MNDVLEQLRKEIGRSDGGLWTFETGHVETVISEIERLREELNGDGILTLPEQVDHAREYIGELTKKYEDMTSIALWVARRLPSQRHKDFAYDEIEANLGREVERE